MPADSPLPATSYSPEDEPPFTEETPFTDEDIEILEKEYCDIINVPPKDLVYAWEAFATKVSSSVCHSCCSITKDLTG